MYHPCSPSPYPCTPFPCPSLFSPLLSFPAFLFHTFPRTASFHSIPCITPFPSCSFISSSLLPFPPIHVLPSVPFYLPSVSFTLLPTHFIIFVPSLPPYPLLNTNPISYSPFTLLYSLVPSPSSSYTPRGMPPHPLKSLKSICRT